MAARTGVPTVTLAALLLAGTAAAAGSPAVHRALAQAGPSPGGSPGSDAVAAPPSAVLPEDEIQGILGKTVRDSSGKEMGRVIDVIVDRASQPRAVVIDFGGFLGVGSRKIAVDWNALRFPPGEKQRQVVLDLTRDQVKAAPEYKEGRPVVVFGAAESAAGSSDRAPDSAEP